METNKTIMCERCYHSAVCGFKAKYHDLCTRIDEEFTSDEKFVQLRCNHFVPHQVNSPLRKNYISKDKEET